MNYAAVTIIGAGLALATTPANAEDDTSALTSIQAPAPGAGVDTAKDTAPTWCGSVQPKEYRASGLQRLFESRYFGESGYGEAAQIICQWPKDPAAAHAVGVLAQLYMNDSGLSQARAMELLALRGQPEKLAAAKKELCAALVVSDEESGEVKQFTNARRQLFACSSDHPMWVSLGGFKVDELAPFLDSSSSEPDVLVRTSYVLTRSARAIFSTNSDAAQNALLAYISDQVDYKEITEADALKLLDEAPYKGNAYARVVALESIAKAKLASSRIAIEVEKKIKDDGWKELIVTAPRRGVESFTTAAAAWKDQLARSVAFEKTFWGPSKKAMQGCWAPLRKDFIAVMKTMKHATENEAFESLNEPIPSLLFGRLAACAAVDKDAAYANVLLGIMSNKLRYSRGPRTAAYYAALAALGEIRADRSKFPVDSRAMQALQMKSTLHDAARTMPSESKSRAGVLGYNVDDGEGTVKSVKKSDKGVVITFVATSTQIMTTSCVTTNRIVTFDHSGNPIYYQKCKETGLATVSTTPDPIVVEPEWAEGIKPGMVVKFIAGHPTDRYGLPITVYTDKKKTKLVSYYGFVF